MIWISWQISTLRHIGFQSHGQEYFQAIISLFFEQSKSSILFIKYVLKFSLFFTQREVEELIGKE